MNKAPHRWFLVSLVHPALSALGLVFGSTSSGAFSYAAALLAFVANLPGIFLINAAYYSTPVEYGSTDNFFFFCFWMITVTWLMVVVPACYLTSRFLSKRALR